MNSVVSSAFADRSSVVVSLISWFSAAVVVLSGCTTDAGLGSTSNLPDHADQSALHLRPTDNLLADSALQRLVELQTARDAAGLVAALEDERASVRARAAFALGSVQDPTATLALTALLGDTEPSVRRDAAFALGQLVDANAGSPGLAEALLRAFETEGDVNVRRALLIAFGQAGVRGSVPLLDSVGVLPEERAELALALSRVGLRSGSPREIVDWLFSSVNDPDPEVRLNASYLFSRSPQAVRNRNVSPYRAALSGLEPKDPAAMHLLKGMTVEGNPVSRVEAYPWASGGPDWRTRFEAVRAVALALPDPAAVSILLGALGDPSRHVALAAAGGFNQQGGFLSDESAQELMDWIDGNPEYADLSAQLLRPLLVDEVMRNDRVEWVLDLMASWLERGEPGLASAFQLLATLRDPRMDELLRQGARSSEGEIAVAAVQGLMSRWQGQGSALDQVADLYALFREVLAGHGADAAGAVADALADPVFRDFGAMDELGSRYRTLADQGDVTGARAVLGALRNGEPNEIQPLFEEASRHPEEGIREFASQVLSRLTGRPLESGEIGSGSESDLELDWIVLRDLGRHPRLLFETDAGDFELTLDAEVAPLTTQAITGYVAEGRYEGVPFHRVVSNFVVQGGDLSLAVQGERADRAIRSELTGISYRRGVVGMARSGKDTETSQFFITHSPQYHLDQGYAAFGWVSAGMQVVDRIQQDDLILRVTVEPDLGN